MASKPFGDFLGINKALLFSSPQSVTMAEQFIQYWNANNFSQAMELVDDFVEFDDTDFPGSLTRNDLERNMRLGSKISERHTIVVDGVANDVSAGKTGILFHTQNVNGSFGKKGAASFEMDPDSGKISKVFWVKENSKGGDANLKILRGASKFMGLFQSDIEWSTGDRDATAGIQTANDPINFFFPQPSQSIRSSQTPPEQYFAAWNERDIDKACSVFSDDCQYDDTAFPQPFEGKENLEKHLRLCAECFPSTFRFSLDDQIVGKDGNIFVRWHVENDGKELAFTRGCSFYCIQNGKITKGIDFVEPPVFKTGAVILNFRSAFQKLVDEPVRFIPLVTWAAYIYVVFFSDWFFGLPATSLEQRTWDEVRDLSLNFFLVSPMLHLPFAPVVHPMLEGVFNLLLAWAAMFAGYLSDDRTKKPNLLPMLPTVVGMQFLTSAFLLPYLVTRSSETGEELVYTEDLPRAAQITESRLLPPFLTAVGSSAILWGILARTDQFGDWNERLLSFGELLSIDRVGSSFLVDLAIFAAFQGWFVDDDARRRGMELSSPLVRGAKFIPFFGMATYLTFRDSLASKDEDQ
jgi:ketosteroid isomerase-like protein